MKEQQLDFVGVGMAKAGTTWVFSALNEHDQVYLPDYKELNYFTDTHLLQTIKNIGGHYVISHRHQGPEWFNEHFKDAKPGQVLGEISPAYFHDPNSPGYILENNPKMKIILNFRNPVDTIYSSYFQLNKMLPVRGTFEDMLERYPAVYEYFKCYKNASRYMDAFPREQVHYIFIEDIKNKSLETFYDLLEFLELEKIEEPDVLKKRVNPRLVVQSRFLRDIILNTHGFINNHQSTRIFKPLMRAIGLDRLSIKIRKSNLKRVEKTEPMKLETRQSLIDTMRDDINRLMDMVDRDLSHWLKMPDEKAKEASNN